MKFPNAVTLIYFLVTILVVYFFVVIPLLHSQLDGGKNIGNEDVMKLLRRIENEEYLLKLAIQKLENHPARSELLGHTSENMHLGESEHVRPLAVPQETVPFSKPDLASTLSLGLSILVVCGTDGSGTRRVVQILTQLGVVMVSEDPETYDIHGDLMGGWPTVVKPVLEMTRSLNYDPDQLSPGLALYTKKALTRLLNQAEADSHKPTSHKLAVGGALARPVGTTASGVKYGFKAPVAMTLVPWWASLVPHFKLLHVVRDGRDIAFSANQGPVEKFYDVMYGARAPEAPAVRAMRLWSDWNTQIADWADHHSQSVSSSPEGSDKSFGYMSLHTEDLVSEHTGERFQAIQRLAQWVQSSLSVDQLCCLAVQDIQFMGSHDRTPRKVVTSEQQLTSRYGKWRGRVEHDASLNKALHSVGQAGLRRFDYEIDQAMAATLSLPAVPAHSSNNKNKDDYQCVLTEAQCTDIAPPVPNSVEAAANPQSFLVPDMCSVQAGVDYKGDDLSSFIMLEPTECCSRCAREAGCKHFTIDTSSNMCFLKHGKGIVSQNPKFTHLISGDKLF